MPSALDRFLGLFRVKPPAPPTDLVLKELTPSDYQSRREMQPQIPLSGWDAPAILQMLDQNSVGNFQMSELFYHALVKEGLIGAAFDMRRESLDDLSWVLQCPKYAPDEMHIFTEALARDWQAVMPDAVRGEITERANVFGFQVSRVEWTRNNGQKQPRLVPYTHSSLSWRQDLWCYQGLSERGVEYISNDGREWVVFSLGGTRPWLKGMLRKLAFVLFGIITGDDRWLNFNDKFAEPIKKRTVPRIMREGQEVQRAYSKEEKMRGGDTVLCPKDDKGYGYDFSYEQVNAQGYETLEAQLARFDDRAAIIILGHNILQSIGASGSRAALGEARKFLRTKACADSKILSTGCESLSKVWSRANFGEAWEELREGDPLLGGQTPESTSWSLVFDLSDPDAKQSAAVQAAQYSQGFASFAKGLQAAGTTVIELEQTGKLQVDWAETAARCGMALMGGEDSYSQNDDDEAELDGESLIDPPAHLKRAAQRSLEWSRQLQRGATAAGRAMARKIIRGKLTRADLAQMATYFDKHEADTQQKDWGNPKRPSNGRIAWGLWGDSGDGRGREWASRFVAAPGLLKADSLPPHAATPLLLSGDSPDSASGLIEGQQQVDRMADEPLSTPGLAAVLAALGGAVDYADLRQRLTGIVRDHNASRDEAELAHRILAADHIGEESIDHDLPLAARTEVDAAWRQRTQADKLSELRSRQDRSSILARAATSYAVYSVARHLWKSAGTAEEQGQPLEMHKTGLSEALAASWGEGGALWDTARAEPLQRAFTHARVRRLSSEPLRSVHPYWKFDAVLDGRTTAVCRGLNGLVRPSGSTDFPVPPLHWRCRSTIRGLSRAEGEAQVTAPVGAHTQAGFGTLDSYPQPDGGPELLLTAYKARR